MRTKYTHTPSDIERFWSKVDRSGGPKACWLWTAKGRHNYGYGSFWLNSIKTCVHAHRFAWFLEHGELPPGMFVCHDCPGGDNPACCNPAHMFLGTLQENCDDRERKGRHPHLKTWDSRGEVHPLAKMTNESVIEARRLYASGGVSQAELARRFGISKPMMNHIILQTFWKHLPSVDELKSVS